MKIRSDYVSNSSSSSFVFQNSQLLTHFNIEKTDIVNAIKNLLPDEEKTFFDVYDLKDKADKKRAYKWKSLLTGWTSSRTVFDEDHGQLYGGSYAYFAHSKWENFISVMEDVFDIYDIYEIVNYSKKKKKSIVRSVKVFDGNEIKFEKEEVPDNVIEVIQKVRNKLGIMFNWEIVLLGISKYLIHFSENTVLTIKGMTTGRKKFETESYSMDRFCEILVNYFINTGKINLKDEYFVRKSKENKSYKPYKELINDILTCCMHEG